MPEAKKSASSQQSFDPNLRWLTVQEAALRARCSPQSIRHFLHEGMLKAARLGQGYIVDVADLDAFLEKRKRFLNPYRRGTHAWVSKRWASQRRKRARAR